MKSYLKHFHSDSNPKKFLVQLQIDDLDFDNATAVFNFLSNILDSGAIEKIVGKNDRI